MSCKSLLFLQIVPFVLLACFVERGVSIRCFSCRSTSDPKCADPFDNSTIPIVDCNSEYSSTMKQGVCRKIREKVNGYWQYSRGCAFIGDPGVEYGDRCVTRSNTDDNRSTIESCTCMDRYGCNSASGLGYNTLLRYCGLFATFFIATWFLRA